MTGKIHYLNILLLVLDMVSAIELQVDILSGVIYVSVLVSLMQIHQTS